MAGRRARGDPVQHRALAVRALQVATKRRQVVAQAARHPLRRRLQRHARAAGDGQEQPSRTRQRVRRRDAHVHTQRSGQRRRWVKGHAHTPRGVISRQQQRLHRCASRAQQAAIGRHAAVDECAGLVHVARGQQHRRPPSGAEQWPHRSRIEVTRTARRRAAVAAQGGVKTNRQRASDRVALHRVGRSPSQRQGLRRGAEERFDAAVQGFKFFTLKHGPDGQLQPEHLCRLQLAGRDVMRTDGHRIRVCGVDDQADVGGMQAPIQASYLHWHCCPRSGC